MALDKEIEALYDAALQDLEDVINTKACEELTELAVSDTLQALEDGSEDLVCDSCEKHKESASFRIDPFNADVFNREVYRMLCDDCEQELRLDV